MEQILYFLFWAALFYFMMRIGGCCGPSGHKHEKAEHEHGEMPQKSGLGPFDPICGMDLSDRTPVTIQFEDKTYYFCSTVCKDVFEKEPYKYATKQLKQGKETGDCH